MLYVLMPEHIHMLVNEPKKAPLSKAIQALKLSVSVQSLERPSWQSRCHDFNVHNEDKRAEKLAYMHRKPGKAGLVEKPEDWQWFSYSHHPSIPDLRIETWGPRKSEEALKSGPPAGCGYLFIALLLPIASALIFPTNTEPQPQGLWEACTPGSKPGNKLHSK